MCYANARLFARCMTSRCSDLFTVASRPAVACSGESNSKIRGASLHVLFETLCTNYLVKCRGECVYQVGGYCSALLAAAAAARAGAPRRASTTTSNYKTLGADFSKPRSRRPTIVPALWRTNRGGRRRRRCCCCLRSFFNFPFFFFTSTPSSSSSSSSSFSRRVAALGLKQVCARRLLENFFSVLFRV